MASSDSKQSSSMIDQRSRIAKIQQLPGNLLCADCSAASPQWASLLLNEDEGSVEGIGVVICEGCAVHHLQEVGDDRCFLKFLQYFHEWTTPELDILEFSGNRMANGVYQAKLDQEHHDPKITSNPNKQAKFIRHKYKKCKFRDEEMLWHAQQALAVRARKVEAMRRRRSSLEMSSRRGSMNMYGSLRRGSMQNGCSLRRTSMQNARRCSGDTCSRRSSNETTNTMRRNSAESTNSGSVESLDRSAYSARSMDGSMLSMADSLVDSSNFSFQIMEDDESFFLACARRSGDQNEVETDTAKVVTQHKEKDGTKPRRRMPPGINDLGYVPAVPNDSLRESRNRMIRRMNTLQPLQEENVTSRTADPPLRKTLTS